MGLLDYFNFGQSEDPTDAPATGLLQLSKKDKNSALAQALLQTGLGIMGAKTGGNLSAAIGQGGMQGVQAYGGAVDDLKREKMQNFQVQRQQEQDAWNKESQARQKAGWGREDSNNAALDEFRQNFWQFKKPDGSFDERAAIAAYGSINPEAALKMQNDYEMKMEGIAARKDQMAFSNKPYLTPITGADGKIYAFDHRTGQVSPLVTSPDGGAPPAPGSNAPPAATQPPPYLRDPKYDPNLKRSLSYSDTSGKNEANAVSDAKTSMKGYETTMAAIERAKTLLPTATNSLLGKGRDALFGAVGATTQAAQDASELDTTAGWLMTNVPKFSGPQSDKDVITYNIMAGQVGDRSKPHAERMRSLQTLEQFMAAKQKENEGVVQPRTFKVLR